MGKRVLHKIIRFLIGKSFHATAENESAIGIPAVGDGTSEESGGLCHFRKSGIHFGLRSKCNQLYPSQSNSRAFSEYAQNHWDNCRTI